MGVSSPTHGPGASQEAPIELTAVAKPYWGGAIPLLYIYGPESEFVRQDHGSWKYLRDPIFAQVTTEAYWGEVVDDTFYLVPELDKCEQQAMLRDPLNFRAPQDGLLFVQYVAPKCSECALISSAIERTIAENPSLSVRWVRISVPTSIGKLSEE